MEILIFTLLLIIFLQRQGNNTPHTAKPTHPRWKVTFTSKKMPSLEIEGASEPLVLKALMAKKIDYRSIAAIEPI